MVRAIAIATLLSLLPAGHAFARGQLQARPTLVELEPGVRAGRLVLANAGDAPVSAQVRVFAWTQAGGEDRLADTDRIAISPMIVTIPPGAEQVVRVVRLGDAPRGVDAPYRLVVDELPSPGAANPGAIELRLRYVVPLFVRAEAATPPDIACTLAATRLECRNAGGRPAQLGPTRLVAATGESTTLSDGLFGYLLPGTGRQWPLDPPPGAGMQAGLRLETRVNGDAASVPVQRAP